MSNNKEKSNGFNCLLRIPNTDGNRNKVKMLNKQMKEYGSRWRLSYRARKPVEGKKYGYGGSLKIEDSQEIGIYVRHDKDFTDHIAEAGRKSTRKEIESIERESRLLRIQRDDAQKQVKILWNYSVNPSDEWYADSCPICDDTDLECIEDYVDSEEWSCANCEGRWTCNKESKRSDLDIA